MRGQFTNIATLVRTSRNKLTPNLSQSELSYQLGYKNGQFISNVERGKCSVPLKQMLKICELLKIDASEMKLAMMRDLGDTIDHVLEPRKELANDAVTDAV